ncbi:MAG: hypothetical protein JXQ26_02745 [Tissierellales bacterium]|nr:hypothetical protein [Tissierellales bacterium]MBN2826876.1 hypothetical protein [Tissierellales bacterium]
MNGKSKGSTLVMLILILAILSILGTALLSISINENRFAIKEHDYQQAYYIARAAAEATANNLLRNTNITSTVLDSYLSTDIYANPWNDFYGIGEFQISIQKIDGNIDHLVIESLGKYNGVESTVKLAVEKQGLFLDNMAVTSLNTINLEQSATIQGDVVLPVGHNAVTKNSAEILGETHHINFTYPDPVDPNYPYFSINPTFDYLSIPLLNFSNAETVTLSNLSSNRLILSSNLLAQDIITYYYGELYYPSLSKYKADYDIYYNEEVDGILSPVYLQQNELYEFVFQDDATYDSSKDYFGVNLGIVDTENGNDRILNFNLDGNMSVQMDSLKITNSGKLLVTGEGLLTMYVDELLVSDGDIEVAGDAKLLIVYLGSDEFTIKTSSGTSGGTHQIDAFIYAPLATMNIENSVVFNGAVIIKDITLSNQSSLIFNSVGIFPEDILSYSKSYKVVGWMN